MMMPDFLDVEDVLQIHAAQIERFGGSAGIRDQGLLESALGQPQVAFGGEFMHPDLFSMAAAYFFHLVSNHPFVDGNKRVGLAAAIIFLKLNGISIRTGTEALFASTMQVAQGGADKEQIVVVLRSVAGES